MKLLISNQHGAIVMALLPFCYGVLLTTPIGLHICLLVAWFALYLMTYPFLALFKGRNMSLYWRWTFIYGGISLVFALPAIWYNPQILYFVVAMLPLVLVNIYYTKTKNERALLNDVAAIIIFAIAGMAAYYFPSQQWDFHLIEIALYPSLFFLGTTLYVKSVMRERKNPIYYYVSCGFHIACAVLPLLLANWLLSLAFVIPLLRAILLPKRKLSVKQTGLVEFAISFYFLVMIYLATGIN
ncbi:YwiC-like family protein [Gallibacterium genomosp. 3]|uniref:Membrane protein n=1 Tax=Gallibacterium genomosp. 3 TaxID=505345 RepID=A0A1A7Q6K1_9PAST|nr:YwiC-like family protein [Gallibacterium genomosp. 3]OBX10478.1 membrane protein [Gallibacterium genomosp. 3]